MPDRKRFLFKQRPFIVEKIKLRPKANLFMFLASFFGWVAFFSIGTFMTVDKPPGIKSVMIGSSEASLFFTGITMLIFVWSQTKKNELGMFLPLILYIAGMLSIVIEAEVRGLKETGNGPILGTTIIVISFIYAMYRHRKFTQEKLAEYDKEKLRKMDSR